jgi:hypothetical protein
MAETGAMQASRVQMGPALKWPRYPDFPERYYRAERMEIPLRARRHFYDWTVYTEEGLPHAEAYWLEGARWLSQLLPERMRVDPERRTGINLGTFTGVFQKAWMRLGYAMYGIELEDVIADLRAYGCEGHRDSVFDLSSIAAGRFDFGVLDRVFCQQAFYERYEANPQPGVAKPPPPYFARIRRILKDDGAFIGMLYDWYSRSVISELAALGGLTLWPMNWRRLAFCVDLSRPPSILPDPMQEPFDSPYFMDIEIDGRPVKFFAPTNEIVDEGSGARRVAFAPPLRAASEQARKRPSRPGDEPARATAKRRWLRLFR